MRYNGKYVKRSAPVPVGSLMIRIAAAMLCLVLLSFHMLSGLYARYTTSGKGEDTARVAKFDVQVVGDNAKDISISSVTSSSSFYQFTIANNSEVAVKYDLTCTIVPRDTGYQYKPDAIVGIFNTNNGELAPGAASDSHTLTIQVDWATFTQNVTGSSVTANLAYTVTVHVEQID